MNAEGRHGLAKELDRKLRAALARPKFSGVSAETSRSPVPQASVGPIIDGLPAGPRPDFVVGAQARERRPCETDELFLSWALR